MRIIASNNEGFNERQYHPYIMSFSKKISPNVTYGIMGQGWNCQENTSNLTTRIRQYIPSVTTDFAKKVPFPKPTRTQLAWFLAFVFFCIVTYIALCFHSCSAATCIGVCNFYNIKPALASTLGPNHSNIRYSHTSRRLPSCIIIGVRKCGTRALPTYLNMHPDVVAATDEVHFFDREDEYHKGLEYYRKKMPYSFKHQTTIEKSPSYFIEPLVPERVYRMNSSILLLLVVRDPVTRLLSDYVQIREKVVKKGKKITPFEEEVLYDDGDVKTDYKAVFTSVYFTHFSRWLEFFPLKQIHIIDGEGLIENPQKEINDVETCLGLEHRIKKDHFVFNKTKGFYCMNDGNLSECLNESKGRKHPDVKQSVLRKLRAFYAKRNAMFFKMANKTFNWSNTDI